jgi:hypothetical protein
VDRLPQFIDAWCIENRRPLLQSDSDFHPIAKHLGLIEVPAGADLVTRVPEIKFEVDSLNV